MMRVIVFGIFLIAASNVAAQDLIDLFPLDHYDQNISTWIKQSDKDLDQPLLNFDMQKKRLEMFYDHYIGSISPWNANYVNQILHAPSPDDLKTLEQRLINFFSNEGKTADQIGYGENFQPYDTNWINNIAYNMNLSQFTGPGYQATHRGIAVDNLHARALPTDDVHFYSHKLAGQGYPFDNLQISALWAGTPVYIIGESRDHVFMLVMTPDYIGWVKSRGIARTDNNFVSTFTKAARNKLVAITHTQTSLADECGKFLFTAYVGSVFPLVSTSNHLRIMVPVANAEGRAIIKSVMVSSDNAALMPLTATPHHFSTIMNTLIGRPYGWGNMYFYNDCSAELKNLLTPFAIWLPRHSSDQVAVGKMIDMTFAPPEKRLSYLMQEGQKFLTLVYIGGHVFMYIGNYSDPHDNASLMAMTYQNMWGLSPHPATKRALIGKSVLFPLLLHYPEETSLTSLANKKYFQVAYLNELPENNSLSGLNAIDIKSLIYPEAFL